MVESCEDDFVDAVVDGQVHRGAKGSIDITGADDIEIMIVRGKIAVNDQRPNPKRPG